MCDAWGTDCLNCRFALKKGQRLKGCKGSVLQFTWGFRWPGLIGTRAEQFWKEVWNLKRASDPLKCSPVHPSLPFSLLPKKWVCFFLPSQEQVHAVTLLGQREMSPERGEGIWVLWAFKTTGWPPVFKSIISIQWWNTKRIIPLCSEAFSSYFSFQLNWINSLKFFISALFSCFDQ